MFFFRNQSHFVPPMLFLTGIPGTAAKDIWVSIAFCSLYAIAIVGNIVVLVVILLDQNLHKPMYLFLSMLALSELGVSISTLPTVLGIVLFDAKEIRLDACLTQMFFIHSFSIMDSGVLWAMAIDRFIAIYNPLQYVTILTNYRIAMIGLAIAARSIIIITPLPILLGRLPFCKPTFLAHPYCLHPNLIGLPCADTTINSRVGLFVVFSSFGLDPLCILLSYVMILKTVLRMASKEGCLKALNTCASHVCAVIIYYTPMIGLAFAHRFGKHDSSLVPTLMALIYLLLPPILNPIIYSIKTKEIRRALRKVFTPKKF